MTARSRSAITIAAAQPACAIAAATVAGSAAYTAAAMIAIPIAAVRIDSRFIFLSRRSVLAIAALLRTHPGQRDLVP